MSNPILDRPFHFIVVLWGRQFRESFLKYCVRSLLAPGNFPALSTRQRSKFLIATRPEDWASMKSTAIFREMERYVEPVFVEIPPCPPETQSVVHMGIGHRLACSIAFEANAYGAILTPDCMLSDGAIRRLQDHAARGVQLVCVAALRCGEEPFLGHLRALGSLPSEDADDDATHLTIPARDMAFAAVNAMHTETLSYEWEASYFPPVPSAAWWRVPGENGILVHCLSWAPLLLDFGAMKRHDTSALENWTIDGDYVFKNLGGAPNLHVVQDSDEMFYAGWSPLSDRPIRLEPRFTSSLQFLNTLQKSVGFRDEFYGDIFDPLKHKLFLHPVCWHSAPLNARWRAVERRARRHLLWSLSKLTLGMNASPSTSTLNIAAGLRFIAYSPIWVTSHFISWISKPIQMAARITSVGRAIRKRQGLLGTDAKRLLTTDPAERAQTMRRIRYAMTYILLGRHLSEPSEKK